MWNELAPHRPEPQSTSRSFATQRQKRRERSPEIDVIGRAVSAIFNVDQTMLTRASRGPSTTALARQAAMYLAHVTLGMTLTDVGRAFGRDRTTVAHACAVVEDARDKPDFDRMMDLAERIVARVISITRCRLCS